MLGYSNQGTIAHLEGEERGVTLTVAYACEVIFGVPPKDLFPALLEDVEAHTIARLHELRDRIKQSTPSQKALAKLELLEQAIGRISSLEEGEV